MEANAKKQELPVCTLCDSASAILHDKLQDRLFDTPGEWRLLRCTNRKCGLAWIDPIPTTEALAAAYENYYTHQVNRVDSWLRRCYEHLRMGYLATRFGYEGRGITIWGKLAGNLLACLPHRRAAFDASVMWLPAQPGGKVLEIGCGNGDLLARLAALGWQVQGIEPDPKSAAIAGARGLPIIVGELDGRQFEYNTFDAIIMSHVIEHVRDPVTLLRTCRNYLKSGGRLVMLTPNLKALGHRWFGRNWLHLDPPRHLHLFASESMVLACQQAGFERFSSTATLRDANWTLAASLVLSHGERYRIGELSRSMKAFGLLFLYLEWFWLVFNRQQGEELLVIAGKG